MYEYFYNLKAPGSHHLNILYWVYTVRYDNDKYRSQSKLLYCDIPCIPLLFFSEFEPGAFRYESIQHGKNINISSRFKPASFRLNVHDATTELPDSLQIK